MIPPRAEQFECNCLPWTFLEIWTSSNCLSKFPRSYRGFCSHISVLCSMQERDQENTLAWWGKLLVVWHRKKSLYTHSYCMLKSSYYICHCHIWERGFWRRRTKNGESLAFRPLGSCILWNLQNWSEWILSEGGQKGLKDCVVELQITFILGMHRCRFLGLILIADF